MHLILIFNWLVEVLKSYRKNIFSWYMAQNSLFDPSQRMHIYLIGWKSKSCHYSNYKRTWQRNWLRHHPEVLHTRQGLVGCGRYRKISRRY